MTFDVLPLTGERTVPGVDLEQYWFTRHEAVYRWLAARIAESGDAGSTVVDAGCGEGYGADILREVAGASVVALDYDEVTIAHAAAAYPGLHAMRANLDAFPLVDAGCSAVVSLQVIEHLWNLGGFLRQCRRVLAPGGLIAVSTPNRPVFSPGLARGATPTNPFHVEEFDADQVAGMLTGAGFEGVEVLGLHHGPRIAEWESRHGSIVAAHIDAVVGGSWPPALLDLLPELTAGDFVVGGVDRAQDLIGLARR